MVPCSLAIAGENTAILNAAASVVVIRVFIRSSSIKFAWMIGHLTKASEHSPNTRAAVELVDQEARPLGVLRGFANLASCL